MNATAQHPAKLPVLLSLLLLAPGAALAEEEQRSASPVPYSNPVLRVGAEMGAEFLLSLGTGISGAYLGDAACAQFSSRRSSWDCLNDAGYGFLAGAMLAAPIGVWGGGKVANGRGTLAGAYIGAGVGAAVGLGANLAVTNDDLKYFVPPVVSMLGAIVGYEISHSQETSKAQQASLTRVQPMLVISGHGGALGLSGSF
jgi:hypothetical protein